MGNRLFVGNLSFHTTEDSLLAAFAPHGEVASVKLMLDRDTGRSRGFAFVEMGNDEQAKAAISALDGKMIEGRTIQVNVARPRENRGGGGGGGGRGGRGGDRGGRW